MGVWNSAVVLNRALGDASVNFDPQKTEWIGAPSVGLPTCGIMGFTGLKTFQRRDELKETHQDGRHEKGGTLNDIPKILNETLGTKFVVIPGYRGAAPIQIALQKREVDGACWGWEAQRVMARAMLDATGDDKFIPFLTHGDSQDPEVKDVPRLTEVIKGKEHRAMLDPWLQLYDFQRPFSLPPGTPKERVNILRQAFKSALEDPQLLAEAKKSKLLITYVSGEQVEKMVDKIMAISPQAKEKLQFLVIKKNRKQP